MQMTAPTRAGVSAVLARMDVLELSCCRFANRSSDSRIVRGFFRVVSRLGDGVFWYALMAALPWAYGQAGARVARVALQMALTALAGLALYRYLKLRLVRERPHVFHADIRAAAPALDRYSFPSGHTLHAVAFTLIAMERFPELGWLLIPFAALVALSRVILGLHYPSDVLAGAAIGCALAKAGNALVGVY
jgi:undecaprenyl-diphosphatase